MSGTFPLHQSMLATFLVGLVLEFEMHHKAHNSATSNHNMFHNRDTTAQTVTTMLTNK